MTQTPEQRVNVVKAVAALRAAQTNGTKQIIGSLVKFLPNEQGDSEFCYCAEGIMLAAITGATPEINVDAEEPNDMFVTISGEYAMYARFRMLTDFGRTSIKYKNHFNSISVLNDVEHLSFGQVADLLEAQWL